MKYHFLGKVVFEDGAYLIKIPFNVWEVCTGQGSFPAEVIAEGNNDVSNLLCLKNTVNLITDVNTSK